MEIPNQQSLRILVIEDSDFDADLMIMRLKKEGFVFEFERVQTKEEYLSALNPDLDIILSDWSLPQFSGLLALKLLREKGYDIPFLIISGSIGEEAALEALRLGAFDYILKDRPDRLGQAIRNAMDQKALQIKNRKAQEALAASEAELRAIFSAMGDLVLVLDQEGYYRKIAPTNISLLAHPPEELLQMNLTDVFPEKQAREYKQIIKDCLQYDKTQSIGFSLMVKDTIKWFEATISPMSADRVVWITRDISERKLAEASIQLQSAALNAAANAIQISNPDGEIVWVNPAFTQLMGYEFHEAVGRKPSEIIRSGFHTEAFYQQLWDIMHSGKPYQGEIINRRKDGSIYFEDTTITPLKDSDGNITHFITIKQDITARKNDEKALRDSEERFRALFKDNQSVIMLLDPNTGLIEDANPSSAIFYGWSIDEMRGMKISEINTLPEDDINREMKKAVSEKRNYFNFRHRLKSGDIRDVEVYSGPIHLDDRTLLYSMVHDITERRLAERALQVNLHRQERIVELNSALSSTVELSQILELLKHYISKLFGYTLLGITLIENEMISPVLVDDFKHPIEPDQLQAIPLDVNQYDCGRANAIRNAKTIIDNEFPGGCTFYGLHIEKTENFQCGLFAPMISEGRVIGTIELLHQELNFYKEEDTKWIDIIANLAALNIQNAKLFTNTRKRLAELAALHAIDTVVTSSHSQDKILKVLLDQISAQLGADAADILLFDKQSQTLRYGESYGFYSTNIKNLVIKPGESYAGKVAVDKHPIMLFDLSQESEPKWVDHGGYAFRYKAFLCLPLILEDEIVGVLEIFQHSIITPDEDWLHFLELLTGQAAIAVSHLQFFQEIQNANNELLKAYDATIEGWSQAMDLRDEETEGHTQRVTQLTIDLAKLMRIDDQKLIHIRRGALLHDIGKLGVPDNILLKPGPLTAEEWVIMKKHPVFAYHMLKKIDYLQPALEIPYCHHEKWDGSGYPRGLKGDEIPLAARIFSVIDVWDALTSDRPYRKAWGQEKTLEYIESQTGSHFDPEIVPAFLSMIKS